MIGNDRASPPQPRMIENDYAYSGWLTLSIKNTGDQPINRVLVFTHPALRASWYLGCSARRASHHWNPGGGRRTPFRPSVVPAPANRFAELGIHIEPGATESVVLDMENGSHAVSVEAWEPKALARFDTYLLLAIGLYWGILFVGVGLLFALRILSGGYGLVSGGFLALTALLFEGASFGFGGASWTEFLSNMGYDPAAVLRPVMLVLVSYFGVQFLRRLFDLRTETPILDAFLRVLPICAPDCGSPRVRLGVRARWRRVRRRSSPSS